MANNPPELRYTQEHEWARQEGATVRVGITHYAQEQLGDVVFVELPKPGTRVTASKSFGVRGHYGGDLSYRAIVLVRLILFCNWMIP